MHIRASHETASLATAALTDVLIVSAFFSGQTCNKIYSVESVSLKHSVSNNMDGKYFQGKCGGHEESWPAQNYVHVFNSVVPPLFHMA